MIRVKKRNPWAWVPTLYFAEGIPYVMVMIIAEMMYKRLGLSNTDAALYTSWLYLPWVIKPVWSPLIDLFRTKRWWIVVMQFVAGTALAGVAFTIEAPDFVQWTLAFFWLVAFSSATHDIAADGFYMLALDSYEQSLFVGIRSTFYRIANIAGQGVTLMVAGNLEAYYRNIPEAWHVTIGGVAILFLGLAVYHFFILPAPDADHSTLHAARTKSGGRNTAVATGTTKSDSGLENKVSERGEISSEQIQKDSDLFQISSEQISTTSDTVASGVPTPRHRDRMIEVLSDFLSTFKSFFEKKGVWVAIAFMLLYRLPEALLTKVNQLFFVDPVSQGGLGLTTAQIGFVNGTVGLIGLTAGGIIGGIITTRGGLKRWLWPMVWSITLPDLVYVYLSYTLPDSLVIVSTCVFVEQFGYGFGFTAYMLYMIYFSQGESETSHYAICTAFMAASMMIPGLFAGMLQEAVGYHRFFIIVMFCCLATIAVARLVKIDPTFGIRKSKQTGNEISENDAR